MLQNYKKLTIPEDVTILLVGESNAGKSTFAHAFANYLKYGEFSMAEENKVSYLPSFSLNGTDTSYKGNLCGQQKDNQNVDITPTKSTCSYIFPLVKYGKRIHLIDTPGFGDVFKEIDNLESILAYINQIDNLHAVCFVLKPNTSTEILIMQYRIKFLLSRLEKSASKNIIFLFTHSGDSNCSHEYIDTVLKGILDQIKSSPSQTGVKCGEENQVKSSCSSLQGDVKYGKENVFCLDNEAFHFLISAKDSASHSNTFKKTYLEIWSHSVAECWRMIEYILGKKDGCEEITPHKVKNIVLLYNARKIISRAAQFFVDIADIVENLECGFVLTDDVILNQIVQSPNTSQGHVYIGKQQLVANSYIIGKQQQLIQKIEHEKLVYKNNKQVIETVLQNLAAFVKHTAMLSCNDSLEAYIKYLINQEIRQAAENNTHAEAIIKYHGLLKQYTEEMRIINRSTKPLTIITTTSLMESMTQLKMLEDIEKKFVTLHKEVITTRTK